MTTSATNLGHQPGACITSVVPRSCLIGRAKGRQAVQRLYVLKSDLAALRRSLVCNTHVVSKVLSMACPLQMVSLIHGLTLRPSRDKLLWPCTWVIVQYAASVPPPIASWSFQPFHCDKHRLHMSDLSVRLHTWRSISSVHVPKSQSGLTLGPCILDSAVFLYQVAIGPLAGSLWLLLCPYVLRLATLTPCCIKPVLRGQSITACSQ